MGYLDVIAAGVAGFVFGAIWYSIFAKPWMAASGVALDANGVPANRSNPVPYIISLVGLILVAGMMRHVFALSDIDTVAKGAVSGLGLGLFIVSPWIATYYGYEGKPLTLTLINTGYATFGCTIIGTVLMIL